MAMVACRECGSEVSDKARTCPRCGVDSPAGQAQLEIRRVSRLTGALISLDVWVDSSHAGALGSGKNLLLTVAPGIHRVKCAFRDAHSPEATQEFDVPAGHRLVVVVAGSRLNGKPLFTAEID